MKNATGSGQAFGIEGYRMPDTTLLNFRPRTTKIVKYNAPHFIDQYTKSKAYIPGPVYETITDWKEVLKGKGKFSKKKRITFTESILNEGKTKG